jgi:hypothetical protein
LPSFERDSARRRTHREISRFGKGPREIAVRYAMIAAGVLSGATGAQAERVNCLESQGSRIIAYSDARTLGTFELTGIARERGNENDTLSFRCSGTFLATADGKAYNYTCELIDAAGDKFNLQNADSTPVAELRYVDGGTGKYSALRGAAAEFAVFPLNSDGTLPACAAQESAFERIASRFNNE